MNTDKHGSDLIADALVRVLCVLCVLCGAVLSLAQSPAIVEQGEAELAARHISSPLDGITPNQIVDTFNQGRDGHPHEALDIPAARGTPVRAVDDGVIQKRFLSRAGGNTIYQFSPGEKLCYYYAHLDHYAEGLAEGMPVKRGQVIGYVGSTGDASPDAPHLHIAVFVLGPEKHWWHGTAINPYSALLAAASH